MEDANRVVDTTKRYCRYLDHYGKHKENHGKSHWDDDE